MNADIALILGADGLAGSAVYLIAGLGLVLIFSVTRVIFVPFGDIAVFAALSLGAMEMGRLPAAIMLIGLFAVIALIMELVELRRDRAWRRLPATLLIWGLAPLLACALAGWATSHGPEGLRVIAAVLLAVPLGPLINRVALQPIAHASVLTLLIAALVLHFLLSGLGLLWFGPEGIRTKASLDGAWVLSEGFSINHQVLLTIAAAFLLAAAFYVGFERTRLGKVLRATASNRTGARLVGIRPRHTALVAHTVAALLAGIVGVLISPVTTIYYDSGLMLGLKAFVAAIIGGLISYPLTALGAVAVGLVESFASFWSGGLKEVIVFGLLIPVLILRSGLTTHADEAEEDEV